jgi:abortive infection bacteriophage resistance protein
LTGYLCDKYGVLGYENKDNFSFSDERFQAFCDDIQKEIDRNARAPSIKHFRSNYTCFESWIKSLSHVRNICAHYGRLYNAKLTKPPRLYKKYIKENISNYRIFAPLLSLKHLLPNDRHWHDFVQTVEILIDKYPSVKLHRMGFPKNWAEMLTAPKPVLGLNNYIHNKPTHYSGTDAL